MPALRSEWHFKDTLTNKTQNFLVPSFHFLIWLHLINFIYTISYSTSSFLLLPRQLQNFPCLIQRADHSFVLFNTSQSHFINFSTSSQTLIFIAMTRVNTSDSISTDSGVFYVEQSAKDYNPPRKNTSEVPSSTQLSRTLAREITTVTIVDSPKPHIVTIQSDSNEPTKPYGYGSQHPNILLSLRE